MPVYDFDEGARKHMKSRLGDIIEMVQSTAPELDFDEKKMRGIHKLNLKQWRNEQTQSRMRGGGGAAQSHNSAYYAGYPMQGGNAL